jgi:hypothetical protein
MNNNFDLPKEYMSFMESLQDNEIISENGYIELFPLNELEKINKEYETDKFVSNFIAIGTNGSGVGIFINKMNNNIYSIPFIGMEEKDAVLLADSFSEFLNKFRGDELEIF